MAYKQYDRFGNELSYNDLQDKKTWCKDGEKIEEGFVRTHGQSLGLKINPEKTTNPYAPDLVDSANKLADLKTQNTPFYKAKRMYSIDPSYAVVFNKKDRERYLNLYPEIDIYFWVDWLSVRFEMGSFTQEVEYISGVWQISFKELNLLLDKAPLHVYQQRRGDTKGNARSSYVLDIRIDKFKRVK